MGTSRLSYFAEGQRGDGVNMTSLDAREKFSKKRNEVCRPVDQTEHLIRAGMTNPISIPLLLVTKSSD